MFILILGGLILTNACKTDTSVQVAPDLEQVKSYLEFKDYDSFEKTIAEVSQMNSQTLDIWENERNFVSMRHLFNEVVKAEERNEEQRKKAFESLEAKKYSSVYIKSPEGGIEPNVADWRKVSVLNADGIVKIGGAFFQFTKDQTKSIPDDPSSTNEIQTLKQLKSTNAKEGIYVNQVYSTRKIVSNGRPDGDVIDTRYKETENSDWRLIGYEETIRDSGEYTENIRSFSIGSDGKASVVITPVTRKDGKSYTFQLKVRTLKKSWYGAWVNRDSYEQSSSGNWFISGGSTLKEGWSSGNGGYTLDPFQSLVYSTNNYNGSCTSTWVITFLTTTLGETNANLRFNTQSKHNIKWNGYGLSIKIPE